MSSLVEYLANSKMRRAGRLFFIVGDGILLVLSIVASVWLRFEGLIPLQVGSQLPLVTALSLATKLPVFVAHRLHAMSWSQVSLEEMVKVYRAATVGSLIFGLLALALRSTGPLVGFPRSILLLDYVITLLAIGAFRMGRRAYLYMSRNRPAEGRVALIAGAGAAGEQLARSLKQTPNSGYAPVGFVDDDSRKIGTVIHGLPVLGERSRLPSLIRQHRAESVLIAMPSAPPRVVRNIVTLAREGGVREIRIVPGLDRILNDDLSFADLREVQLPDLLGRAVVQIDTAGVQRWLKNRTLLVTGAGGSVGSELCRQLIRFGPRELIALDWDESALFWIEQELRRLGGRVTASLGDIRDSKKMGELFATLRPQVVFHAAAYKHVGLMERHPEEAIRTNILGTLSVAQASIDADVEKFILISTDKAVSPTSIMGVTKRVAEQVCLALGNGASTRFLAVRFGNVLGSRGSVVPLFQENIRRGEPLTVRGPNMRRYFMATSEAVLLVLQAGAMGEGGEIFVLDMGEPVRVIDLAKELILLSGLEPEKDVPIIYADPEPGEKEFEDLLTAEEGTVATRHDRIFVARVSQDMPSESLLARMDSLREHTQTHNVSRMIQTLEKLVPTYSPSELLLQKVRLGQDH